MSKALVTGAGGFIGSHLVERLLRDGWEVVAFRHYNSQSDYGNLDEAGVVDHSDFEVVFGELRDAGSVRSAMAGCTHVFHLGALVAIPYSYVNPEAFVETNVKGTQNVLEAARGGEDVERVVVTSTSEVYGTAQYTPIDEEHPLQGQSPYAASKIGADHLAESYVRSFDLPVGILRPFNTFGPRQSMRAIIPTIIVQLLSRDVVELGNLSPRRDLTYVEDTVEGFVRMATEEVPYGEPVNIGRGDDISIGDLFELLRELTGSEAELETAEERKRPEKSEVMRLMAEAEKAERTLGWTSGHTLEDGLEKTIDWVRGRLDKFRADEYHV